MQKESTVLVQKLALPKGGGAIVGLGDRLSPVGSTGMAGLAVALPLSPGRGYAPALTLTYNSGAGNGAFGLGWQLGLVAVQRRTNRGVPWFDGRADDEFVGPDGEVLVCERDAQGYMLPLAVAKFGTKDLGKEYQVTRYFPRIEGAFQRIERWRNEGAREDFWLIHDADGQLHCLGKTAAARIANPVKPNEIAEWLIEESVNPTGEHIYYRYLAENQTSVSASNEAGRDHTTNRYLAEVYYGNCTAAADLYLWDEQGAQDRGWLFSAVFDYGERGISPEAIPPYTPPSESAWSLRADSFSRYHYGFEVRTHRLCRQVLMFHHFPKELHQDHTLVQRLLLSYQESAIASQLEQVRTLAYESDGALQSLPPLEFVYSTFDLGSRVDSYRIFEGLPALNDSTHYQLVDLFGEGLPGMLVRDGSSWRYRPPIRGKAGTDEVGYGDWETLPAVPSMQPTRLALMDVDGDGRLDWLVTQPGLSGCFSLKEGKQWSAFTPFNALPVEFFHPQAQLADLVGAGLSDLAVIGPRSVRLYPNQRGGYGAPIDVIHDVGGPALPTFGGNERELVAFSDVLGSGQPHLICIRFDGLTCWPNLGHGRFGTPFQMAHLGFDHTSFNPDQLFLADLDGSGAADLIYFERDFLTVYLNQSGNSFAPPVQVPLPEGLAFDRLCRVSFADLQGTGVVSLVISHPHMQPSHWRLDFVAVKPYLMVSVNNNMGASTTLRYRSSAQYWLDDKQVDPKLTSALPMSIHTLAEVQTFDEVTGYAVMQQYSYHHGVYDSVEREFCGFGLVLERDAELTASTTPSEELTAPPRLTKSWYHTGRQNDETDLPGSPYRDAAAVTVKASRFTRFDAERQLDTELDLRGDATTLRWLFRALKGVLLRREVYGLDGSDQQAIPYTVLTSRYQVRLLQAGIGKAGPVAIPSLLEQVDYNYERIAVDPMVAQQVHLQRDRFNAVVWQVTLNYPRRPKPDINPYPDSLPPTSWASSYDDQQASLILNEQLSVPRHLDDPQAWRLRLPHQQRSNVLVYDHDEAKLPTGGLSFEFLTEAEGLLASSRHRVYGGHQLVVYADNAVPMAGLVDHVESAEFDDEALLAFDGALDEATRDKLLETAGYQQVDRILARNAEAEDKVWVAPRGYTTYGAADAFFRPTGQRSSRLVGAINYEYDESFCVLTKTTDVLGNTTVAEYDYRFLRPHRIIDLNGNTQEVRIDALGRVVASSFYGTEAGKEVGFGKIADFSGAGLSVASAVSEAGKSRQTVATLQISDPFSWMGKITRDMLKNATDNVPLLWSTLEKRGFITAEGWLRLAGHQWAKGAVATADIPEQLRELIQGIPRIPVQSAALVADRYPSDDEQQVRVSLTYFDGLGRALQAVKKVPAGDAWQRDSRGEIVVGSDGKPISTNTDHRWAVSGKIECNNKGQPVRKYQPYFIDAWQYVCDAAMRSCGYADTYFYDALGREVRVLTAKKYLRRTGYYPWFTVTEDENDTWQPEA